jgi:hypothetical protein
MITARRLQPRWGLRPLSGCCDGSVGTGLRVRVAIGRGGGADVLGRRFCSEAFAIRRVICSWLALSCSICCSTLARSRAIVWSTCVGSGDTGAAVGATFWDAV